MAAPTPTLSERIAAEVRAELARRQMTVQDLAVQIYGVSPATMRRKLTGLYPLDADEIDKVAIALGLTPTELVARADQQEREAAR